ncbi:unnamed protein product [Linum tenue]|uniref:Uncharacterized protein n=1 Tax=Linum tenue TaxID=586396 RepID=A0AAV0LPJ2_9ROSI|nr:unnamed protein product [Linum tenue]
MAEPRLISHPFRYILLLVQELGDVWTKLSLARPNFTSSGMRTMKSPMKILQKEGIAMNYTNQ